MAFLGGVIFNAANILLVAAIAIAGMSVAFPVGIGIALVWGVVVNYASKSEGQPVLLFLGVAGVAAAIVLNAIAYRKLPNQKQGNVVRGLVLAVLCGILMGNFYWCVAESMAPKFAPGEIMESGKLSPYTAMVLFSLGVVGSNFAYNFSGILKWFTGTDLPRPEYLTGNGPDHLWGVLGGVIWAIGMTFNIIAQPVTGPAVSYGLGQGATMVAAAWGVFIWREFRDAPKGVDRLIWAMFAAFVAGLGLIVLAKAVAA
jgi:glucose uptake protein